MGRSAGGSDSGRDRSRGSLGLPLLRVEDAFQDWLHQATSVLQESQRLQTSVADQLEELAEPGSARPQGPGLAYVIYDVETGHAFADEFVRRLEALYPSTAGRVFVEHPQQRLRRAEILSPFLGQPPEMRKAQQGRKPKQRPELKPEDAVRALFDLFDSDKDERLSPEEWRKCCLKLTEWAATPIEKAVRNAHLLFETLSRNSGYIQFDGFLSQFFRVESEFGFSRKDLISLFEQDLLTNMTPKERAQASVVIVAVTSRAAFEADVCADDLEYFRMRHEQDPSLRWVFLQHKRVVPVLLPLLDACPDFLRQLLGATAPPRAASGPAKSRPDASQTQPEPTGVVNVLEYLPDLGDLLTHAFIRSYHDALRITSEVEREYCSNVSQIVQRPQDGRETHLLVAFDRRKKGLLHSWNVVRSLRRFCRAHLPWVTVCTFSHILLEHRLKKIPPGSRVCVVIIVTPQSLNSLDVGMDIHDAARWNVSAMQIYDVHTSPTLWTEFDRAPDSIKPRLAGPYQVPFLESYGIGPSTLCVLTRLFNGGQATMLMAGEDGELTQTKEVKKAHKDEIEPVKSDVLLIRFSKVGGDWGYELRSQLLDQAPLLKIVTDFHAELERDRLLDMVQHTKVLCVLLSEERPPQEVLAAAKRSKVCVLLLQDVHEPITVDAEDLRWCPQAGLFPVLPGCEHAATVIRQWTVPKTRVVDCGQLCALLAPELQRPTAQQGALSCLANALSSQSGEELCAELAKRQVVPQMLAAATQAAPRTDGPAIATELLRALEKCLELDPDATRATAGLKEALQQLRHVHAHEVGLAARLGTFQQSCRAGGGKVSDHVRELTLEKFEEELDQKETHLKHAVHSAAILMDVEVFLQRLHGERGKEEDDLKDECVQRVKESQDALQQLQAEVSKELAGLQQQLQEIEVTYMATIPKYANLKTDLGKLAQQKNMPPAVGPSLEMLLWLLVGIDPAVDYFESDMRPRDVTWVGLRKLIYDPDRFLLSVKDLAKEYRQIPARNLARVKDLLEQNPKNTTLLDTTFLHALCGLVVSLADKSIEVQAVEHASALMARAKLDISELLAAVEFGTKKKKKQGTHGAHHGAHHAHH